MNTYNILQSESGRKRLIIGVFIFILFPFLAVSWYAFPISDDYCFAAAIKHIGYWNFQVHYYKTWSGRYVGTLLSSSQPLIYGSYTMYKIVPQLFIISFVFAIHYFIKNVTRGQLSESKNLWLTLVIFWVFFGTLPTVGGYFYWYTGYYYTIADIGTLLLLGYICKNYEQLKNSRTIFIISLSLVFLIGCNEYTLVWLCVIIGSKLVIGSLMDKKIKFEWLVFTVVAALFAFISVLAPGNAIRAAAPLYKNPHKYDLVYTFKNAVISVHHNLLLMAPYLGILAIVLIPAVYQLFKNKKQFSYLQPPPILSWAIYIVLLILCYAPSFYSIAEPPNLRGQGVINFWTMIGWIYNISVTLFWCFKKGFTTPEKLGIINWGLALFMVLTYISNFNFRTSWSDLLSGRAARFHAEMVERTQLVENSKSNMVVVKKLQSIPYTLIQPNIINDSGWFSGDVDDGCVQDYFQKTIDYKE